MGEEKLDNTVYTIRGYADLADLAAGARRRGDPPVGDRRAQRLRDRFEQRLVVRPATPGRTPTRSTTRGNAKVFQRHWIGLTPTDAVLPRPRPSRRAAGLRRARPHHARPARTEPCYTGELGLFHTGTGPTTRRSATPGDAATRPSPRCLASGASSR